MNHHQLARIGFEMGSREGRGLESRRFRLTMVLEQTKNKILRVKELIE